MPEFPIIQVRPEELIGDEALGSKTKFWFRRDDQRWLFKEVREGTGEDWAEKIAAEVARLAGIGAATVELADFQGTRGCASLSFVRREEGDAMIHGNEILAGMVLGYDRKKRFHQSQHTLENIEAAIQKLFPDRPTQDRVLGTLASYLVLDALIGNTDRHHENWALLATRQKSEGGDRLGLQVAPSFDHASSLGREMNDQRRENLMKSNAVETYVRKGRGAIYFGESDPHGANPLRLVEFGARRLQRYFLPPLQRVKQVSLADLKGILDNVPADRMSVASKGFALAFLTYTHNALGRLVP